MAPKMGPIDPLATEESPTEEHALHGTPTTTTEPSTTKNPEERNPMLAQWPEDPSTTTSTSMTNCCCHFVRRQFDHWTFSYMNHVLRKGARQRTNHDAHLTHDDLFPVPQAMQSVALERRFQKHYHPNKQQPQQQQPQREGITNSTKRYSVAERRLLWTLWKIAAPTFVPAGLCELVVVLCGTAMPLLVRALLTILEDHPQENVLAQGLPYAIAIFAVSLLNGIHNHRHRHLAMKTGVALRAAMVNIIYQHVLQLAPSGKRGLTSGAVTNLVAVDAQKLFEVTQEGHLIWALPVSVLLVSFFLYRILGPATLVGIAVLVLYVPLIERVTAKMLAIRQRRVHATDRRVDLVASMLQGIRVTKLNHYEQNYQQRVTETREEELTLLSKEMAVWAITLFMTVTSPVFATAACFGTYVFLEDGNVLTAADTFGVLLLFSALRFPINFAGRLIGKAAQAMSAVQRMALFLERPLREDMPIENHGDATTADNDESSEHDHGDRVALTLQSAGFRIGGIEQDAANNDQAASLLSSSQHPSGFTVSEFNVSIRKGQVLAVCGPVGSGKSTLIYGILGEADPTGGTVITKHGTVSYVPQTPFILNQTLRDNILFGLPFDADRYEQVLDACCLRPDLEQLGDAGDLTEIGERGVTLSGGQKQRAVLARAAYAQSSLIILDDVFSALDSGTAKIVFERLIASPNAFWKDSAVLLVTHASHFISNRAINKILLMVDGKNQFYGSWDDLSGFDPQDSNTKRAVDHIKSSVREDANSSDSDSDDEEGDELDGKIEKKGGRLIQIEQREHGLSSLSTWLLWFRRAGGWSFITFQILFLAIDRFAYVAVEWFLAQWTSGAYEPIEVFGIEFPAQTDGRSAQLEYLKFYLSIILVSACATLVRSEWGVTGGVRASRNVFHSMLSSVLRAPMSYFETQPMGRILNRFTYDTDVNDVTLTQVLFMFMISCSWYCAGVAIQVSILPWSAFAIVPVSIMYWVLMLHYRQSGPDLQRLDALSRSPVQSMVSECLEGSTSILVFHQDKNFLGRFRSVVDTNSSALLNFVSAQRWLGVRMELLGSIVVLTSTVLVVCLNEVLGLEPGLVGMLIMWSSHFTITLNFLVDTFAEAEAAITAIERVDAMSDLPSEKPMVSDAEHQPPEDWPKRGILTFEKACLRYREGLPLALKDVSFTIPAGKSCGIVGRTGSGKSSLTAALFRLVELESGRIFLDGVDLGEIGLSDVRGRGMAIIPQDPFLAGATLRECLDPFGHHADNDILEALQSVRLGGPDPNDTAILSGPLEEGGSNYSVGERQLLNLARALLSQPKVLVLDEATASIDGETDAFIQQMLRTRFPNTTLLTIAHRLQTIMDYDYSLVMDAGRAAEFGHPAELLEIPGGILSELVTATGPDSACVLRQIASESAERTKENVHVES